MVIHTCQEHATDYDDHNDDGDNNDDGGDYDGILGRWPGQAPLVEAQPPVIVIVVIHTCQEHATDYEDHNDDGGDYGGILGRWPSLLGCPTSCDSGHPHL